jgi:hypothetical protein
MDENIFRKLDESINNYKSIYLRITVDSAEDYSIIYDRKIEGCDAFSITCNLFLDDSVHVTDLTLEIVEPILPGIFLPTLETVLTMTIKERKSLYSKYLESTR